MKLITSSKGPFYVIFYRSPAGLVWNGGPCNIAESNRRLRNCHRFSKAIYRLKVTLK